MICELLKKVLGSQATENFSEKTLQEKKFFNVCVCARACMHACVCVHTMPRIEHTYPQDLKIYGDATKCRSILTRPAWSPLCSIHSQEQTLKPSGSHPNILYTSTGKHMHLVSCLQICFAHIIRQSLFCMSLV